MEEEDLQPLSLFFQVCARLAQFREKNRADYPAFAALLDQVFRDDELGSMLARMLDLEGTAGLNNRKTAR